MNDETGGATMQPGNKKTSASTMRLKIRAMNHAVEGAVNDWASVGVAAAADLAAAEAEAMGDTEGMLSLRALLADKGFDLDAIRARVPNVQPDACYPDAKVPQDCWLLTARGMRTFWAGKGKLTPLGIVKLGLKQMMTEETRKVLRHPHLLETPKQPTVKPFRDIREMLSVSGAVDIQAMRLGESYFTIHDEEGLSDFITGRHDDAFNEAVRSIQLQGLAARKRLYATQAYWESPLGRVHQDLGEMAARITRMTVVAELGLLTGPDPLTARRCILAMYPANYCQMIGPVCCTIKTCVDASYLKVCADTIRPWTRVLVSEFLYGEMVDWLDSAVPVASCDAPDLFEDFSH